MNQEGKMDPTVRDQLIRKRGVARGMLTRMQTFLDSGNTDINQLQVRLNRLPSIFCKFETVQEELEATDDCDHSDERASFETQYFEVEAKFHDLLHDIHSDTDRSSNHSNGSNSIQPTHSSSAHIRLPTIELPNFEGNACTWLHYRDTFEALIVNNQSLSCVQKHHYLISSLKAEAKSLIVNLPITNDNFAVAWGLITQRYNNIKLIAMKHVSHLFDRPQVKRGDASSLRTLINHMSSHMNALNALVEGTSMHDLMLNHLFLSALDSDSHREWELSTSGHQHVSPISEVIEFLENKCRALELLQTNQSSVITTTQSRHMQPTGTKVGQSPRCNLTTHSQCPLCKGPHRLFACNKFITMNPKERMDCTKQIRVCLNCLQPNSQNHKCSTGTCRTCNRHHHSLLHITPTGSHSTVTQSKEGSAVQATTCCSFKGNRANRILLATAVVEVRNKANQYVPCRILLDSGSQLNFVTERYVQNLRLSKSQTPIHVQGINNVNTSTHHSVHIHLRSRISDWHATTTCAVLPTITGSTPAITLDTQSWNIPTDIKLADEMFYKPGPIDMLIGADLFYELLLPDSTICTGLPVLQKTVLGWILSGNTPMPTTDDKHHSFVLQDTTNLELNLNRFWEVEAVEFPAMTPEQQTCEQHFINHTTQQRDGRFVVKLPLKGNPNDLGTSRRTAETRLLAIERRLDKNPDLKVQYHRFMQDYEAAGHMELAHHSTLGENTYYLPHHPVFKETSTTTKTRVVFDGGARSSTGLSLNDILQVGPTVQQDLYALVLRFRTHQVCFTADIAQMYRQVKIHPQDRDLQRILWRYTSDEPIKEYRLTTVTYGTASAPFLATRCLRKLAEDNLVDHPRAAQVLRDDFYVDDLLSGTSTVEEAITLQQELSTLLATAGFPLRKWASNHPRFLANIPTELQETRQTLSLDNEDGVTALGLQWNPRTDQLQVRNNSSPSQSSSTASTKRTVLASTASIFDPLGLLNPAVIVYKIFLQDLWQHKLDWDAQLPTLLQHHWNRLLHTIPQLFHTKVPRKVICANANNIQIHGFCDSSERAYGACLYIRSTNDTNQISCELLCSSSKVAPLKQLTIPRLELCAAVLLAKLFRRTMRALNMPGHESYLWTDSLIVLTWIRGTSTRWKTFVGNRVALIQEATAAATWRHVPSASNPADLISRGTDPTTLSTDTLWWHGPDWLLQTSSSWPSTDFKPATEDLEIKKTFVSVTASREDITERFSSLTRLIRVMAYCRRFIHNCRQTQVNRKTTTLTTQDLDQALTCCVKQVQQVSYAQEILDLNHQHEVSSKSSLSGLHPFIDQERVLRVGGRLQQSALPYQAIHQMILPPSHHFTQLVVSSEHIRLHHAGPQLLIASIREKYWIPRIRNIVKTVIHHCLTCYRYKAQASQQLMSELPSLRVRPARPFLTTGVDYAGPVSIRLGPPRSKQISKGYIAIFVCFVIKAVHIELVTSLTTDAFLAALKRFIARRGKPRTIYSDNGTSFQGAAHQLHKVYAMLHSSSQMTAVQDYLTSEGCTWRFIPPHGPHHGGLWEAAVKSMKHHLRRTLGSQIATYEELYTLLTEIEACLNSRPLCALSSDPHSSTYLSPGHFLIGDPLVQIPTVDLTDVKSNRLSRWQSYQQQLQVFWKRWSADYLHDLHQRQRWQKTTPNLQPGEVVLLKEDNTPPLHWPLAIITEVHPGSDGKVRVVTLKTPQGIFKRPIAKICPLPHVNDEL